MVGTTQLDAVNIMLSAIGEAPVSSLSSGLIEAEIAETIFERMETSQIRLDTTTFNTLLSAWGRQRDPERAADILHHMLIKLRKLPLFESYI